MNKYFRWAGTLALAGVAGYGVAGAAAYAQSHAAASTATPVNLAFMMAETGPFAPYGLPAQLATELAVKDVNEHGGVLGRPVKLVNFDTQGSPGTAIAQARQIASSDAAVVTGILFGNIRNSIRPVFSRAKKMYFFPQASEGGVCDKNFFDVGAVPYQQLAPMLKYMAAEKGLKKWFVVAPNYIFGRVSAHWVQQFAKDDGATIVDGGLQFFPLNQSDFSSTLSQIQASHADLIVSFLIGNAQVNFYKLWAASGLNKTTTIASGTYGEGGEQVALGGVGKGIYAAYQFLPTAASEADPNNRYTQMWKASGTKLLMLSGAPTGMWNGVHLWANAVNKAGSLDYDKVMATLETGTVSFEGPGGRVYIDGPTHQIVTPMNLYQDNGNGSFDFVKLLAKAAQPVYMQSKCDLIKNPTLDQLFLPTD